MVVLNMPTTMGLVSKGSFHCAITHRYVVIYIQFLIDLFKYSMFSESIHSNRYNYSITADNELQLYHIPVELDPISHRF